MNTCKSCSAKLDSIIDKYCNKCEFDKFMELTANLVDYECVNQLDLHYQPKIKPIIKTVKIGTLCKIHPNWTNEKLVFINTQNDLLWHGISKEKFEKHFELREQMTLF